MSTAENDVLIDCRVHRSNQNWRNSCRHFRERVAQILETEATREVAAALEPHAR